MRRRPPDSTRTDTLFPYTTLFRSIVAAVDPAMPGPDGKKERVSRPDLDDPPAGTAEREPCDAREDAERLMGGRVIMMIVENRVAPLRRPVMIRSEEHRAGKGCVHTGRARVSPA